MTGGEIGGLGGYAGVEQRPRIVIADDDAVVRQMLAATLSRWFDLVGVAEDAAGAVDIAVRHLPDVALLDVQMPAGGGLWATRRISELAPATAVVLLSGDEYRDSVVEFMNVGATTYLRKGIADDLLTQRLLQSIAAHQRLAQH